MTTAKTIGIVGGGQLGRMLSLASHELGFRTIILDPTPESPAGQVADKQIVGSFKDKDAILSLAQESDVLTFEIESANAEALEELEKKGTPVYPTSASLAIIKNKYAQKQFLREHSIPVADFVEVEGEDGAKSAGKEFGYPYLLKAKYDAYDGRGNALIEKENDIVPACEKFTRLSSVGGLSKSPLYAEKFVPFTKELAVIVARSTTGEVKTYPVVETIHKNNICHVVIAPASVAEEVKERARDIAHRAIDALAGVGVFAVEMFLLSNGDILVNEIAPRVHNSGHYSIEGAVTSQFENHIRAITGMPLGDTSMREKSAVMVNILGEREGKAEPIGVEEFEKDGEVFIHLYGKVETRYERKMGHITVVGEDAKKTKEKALQVRKKISI